MAGKQAQETEMRRVSAWHTIVLNVYWIGLSFMWNSLHVIIDRKSVV